MRNHITRGMSIHQKVDFYLDKSKEEGDCWLWKAHHNHRGYPVLNINGKVTRVNRIQFERFNRKLEEGECVLHSCDNKGCINPKHLRAGTDKENKKEMFDRKLLLRVNGRFVSPKTEQE